ncbi:MAG: putative holin-like toxin [Clostridium sp.]|nr:putative holin-like toxin [Clostridium sp.]
MLQGGSLPKLATLLILFGTFLIALLAYIDRNNKRK